MWSTHVLNFTPEINNWALNWTQAHYCHFTCTTLVHITLYCWWRSIQMVPKIPIYTHWLKKNNFCFYGFLVTLFIREWLTVKLSFRLQECSPYAAHLFDAEDANTPMRMLPGLCGDYCSDYWQQCRYTLSLILENVGSPQQFANLTATIEEDRRRFCDFLELKDIQYCYPNVLTNAGIVYTWDRGLCSAAAGTNTNECPNSSDLIVRLSWGKTWEINLLVTSTYINNQHE